MKAFFFFFFLVSSAALQKRQENVEACWSVKKILKPAGASRKYEALLERQENFEAKNVSQDFYGVEN